MNKNDVKTVVDELRNDVSYPDTDITPLFGCGLPDFPDRKFVSKEVIVSHLRWQCMQLNGNVDENQLTEEIQVLRDKRVVMI